VGCLVRLQSQPKAVDCLEIQELLRRSLNRNSSQQAGFSETSQQIHKDRVCCKFTKKRTRFSLVNSILYSGSTPANTQQTLQQPSLFGGATNAQQSQQGNTLFGQSTQQQSQQQRPSLFGGLNMSSQQPANQSTNLFGGSTLGGMGNSTTNVLQNASAPGATVSIDSIKPTTKFTELTPEVQNEIIRIDDLITQQINFRGQIAALLPSHGETLATIPPDVAYLEDRMDLVETQLENDAVDVAQLKKDLHSDAEDARLSFRAIENLKLPAQFHYSTLGSSGFRNTARTSAVDTAVFDSDESATGPVDLLPYFEVKRDGIDKSLATHARHIAEVEAHLGVVESSVQQKLLQLREAMERNQLNEDAVNGASGNGSSREKLRELGEALRAVEGAILGLASRVGEVREGVVDVTVGGVI
jgi:nucleoporin p58/p45